jgi:hypothetical protein
MAFNEKLEVVELNASNTVVSLLNLNDGAHYFMGTKTFKVIAPAPTRIEAADQRRWGGTRQVGETHSNGIVSWEANVAGATSQEAIERVEVLLAQLAANPYPLFVLWQAAGVSEPTLYQMRGTGHFEPLFEVGVLEGAGLFPIQVEIPVAPLALGLPVKIIDETALPYPAVLPLTEIPGDAPALAEVTIETGEEPHETFITGAHMPRGIAANSEHIYWANSATGYLGRATVGGSGVEQTWLHTEGEPYGVTVDATHVYWTDRKNGYIGRATLAGGSIEKTWISGLTQPLALAVNATYVWWATYSSPYVGRCVLTEPTKPEPSWVSVKSISVLTGIALYGEDLYVGEYAGDIIQLNISTKTTKVLLNGGAVGVTVAVNAQNLFWTTLSSLGRANLTGAEPTPNWVPLASQPFGVAVEGEYAFFTLATGDIGYVKLERSPPVYALLGWTPKPTSGLAAAPFGVLDSATAEPLRGWVYQTVTGAKGGKALYSDTETNFAAQWSVDPATMTPDSFSGELTVEVLARVLLGSELAEPFLTLSAQPQDGLGYGAARYTDEWGSAGRPLVVPGSGEAWRMTRLGTLHLLCNPLAPRIWKLYIFGHSGAIAPFALDYLVLAPSLQRACSPTSKENNAAYPQFITNTTPTVKAIRSNLSAVVAKPGKNGHPDHGLGGQLLQFPPGETDLLLKLSSLVPDSPAITSASEQLEHECNVTVWVTPRWFLTRTS